MKVASVCVALAALLAVVVATKPLAHTTLGVVAGVYDATTNTNSWKGVPYAASTAGANRFQPPKARAAWTGEHDASAWGPGCVQYKKNPDAPAIQSEDCLHANVFAPQNAQGLPVVVWIHGGGFMEGSNIGPYEVYDGKRFASRAQVVVIAINYRLGSLGFLVSGTGDSDIPGNMGFEDQQFALAWVKANAAAFGGDPTKVTLWGESAGAMSIGLHMISPNSKGLFHRVIMESNPLAITYKEQKDAAVLGRDTCKRAGCEGCGLACMQAVPTDKLMDASRAAAGSTWNTIAANYKHILGALLDFTPVVVAKKAGAKVDTNIPSQVIPALVSGKYEQVPMITGTNLEEGQTFVYEALSKPLDMLAVKAGLVLIWPFHAETMLDAYTRKTDTDGREPLSRVVTDFLFTCPSQQFALAGAQAKTKQNAWVYQYQHVFSIPKLFTGLIPDRCATAVCHAVELPIVFHNGPVMNGAEQPLSAAENVLSDQIIGYFGNFIRTANPNSGSNTVAIQWPVFNPTTRNALVLGGSFAGTQAFFVQTCKRWDDVKYGAGPLVNSRFRAVNEDVESVEDEDEMDAADEVEDEVDDEDEDEGESESDAEMDVEDTAEMEDFVEDEAEAERYEFADA